MIDGVTRLGLPHLPGVRHLYVNRSVAKTRAARWTSGSNLSFTDGSNSLLLLPPPQKTTKYILYNVTAKYRVSLLPKYGRKSWGIKKMKNLPNVARLYESHTNSALPLGTATSRQSNSITENGLEKNCCRPYITYRFTIGKLKDAGYTIKNANIWLSINNASFY